MMYKNDKIININGIETYKLHSIILEASKKNNQRQKTDKRLLTKLSTLIKNGGYNVYLLDINGHNLASLALHYKFKEKFIYLVKKYRMRPYPQQIGTEEIIIFAQPN